MIQRALRDSDVIAGALLAALGVFIVTEARKWEYMGFDGPGPGFFPLWYGLVITVLSLWLAVGRALRLGREDTKSPDWSSILRALGTWAAFALSVALMPLLGFVVSFGLLTLALVVGLFHQPVKTALLTAIGLSLGFHLLFSVALNVALPTGPLGF